MSDYIKCSKNGSSRCIALANRLEDEPRKGFRVTTFLNMRTGAERYAGVCYRTSSKDRGLMLNFCPWCGSDIVPEDRGKTWDVKRATITVKE